MAGIIVFDAGDWRISNLGFNDMVNGVSAHLTDSPDSVRVKDALEYAVACGLRFIDAGETFTPAMIAEFASALERHIDRFERAGKQAAALPELYDGHLARLRELRLYLRGDGSL